MGKVSWSSSNDDRDVVCLLEKQEKPLGPKPPPWQAQGRKEVGHNEHREFLCFAPGLGNQQRGMKQSIWLVRSYWIEMSPTGKAQRAEEGLVTRVPRTEDLVPQPSCCQIPTQVLY